MATLTLPARSVERSLNQAGAFLGLGTLGCVATAAAPGAGAASASSLAAGVPLLLAEPLGLLGVASCCARSAATLPPLGRGEKGAPPPPPPPPTTDALPKKGAEAAPGVPLLLPLLLLLLLLASPAGCPGLA